MPSLTRRQLVGGTAIAAVAGGGYYLRQRAPSAVFEAWTPEPGTWPLPQYDTANTAHNPHARPPRQAPARRRLTSVDSPRGGMDALVGESRIVLSAPGGVTDLRDGASPAALTAAAVQGAGVGPDGRLHVVQHPADGKRWTVVGYEGTTEAYRVPFAEGGHPDGLTVGRGGVYVWTTGDTVAVDPAGRTWPVEGETAALAGDQLYTAVGLGPGLFAHAGRTGLDGLLHAGPRRVWEAEMGLDETEPPAVADGRLVLSGTDQATSWVAAYDVATGDRLWEPRNLGRYVSAPAVVGDRAYTVVGTADLRAGRVVALDLATGETVWSDETDWYARHPAVGGDTLCVVGEVRDDRAATTNTVRAYDTGSGDVLWTETFESTDPTWTGRALVGERVLVALGDTLYELA